tara:strand:+ start:164 stop:628 length:465 start_codon:yes stop_codon:yes gene_type:complete
LYQIVVPGFVLCNREIRLLEVGSKLKKRRVCILVANVPDLLPEYQGLDASLRLITCLTTGGDARITLDREPGLNRYLAAPYPRRSLAFASSTANDMSQAAFDYLLARAGEWGGTLRIGLSMPQVVSLSALGDHELERVIFSQLSRFADALAVPA